ncbi:MAG: xylulokinase [Oscillospiraceae bacterium]|nr:xylulokinase [Oscillospiraceae bacterium]
MIYIGIDLGTSAVKLLALEEGGEILCSVSREYPVHYPAPGFSEQNPGDWLESTLDGLSELLDGVDRYRVKGIGFGGQMHGLVILDEDDRVIRPCILWNDGRTDAETRYLNTEIGMPKLAEYTGNIAFAGFTAPKLLWLKKNEPDNFARIRKIMLPKDYLAYMLTGVHSTDYSDASGTLLLDVKAKRWSKEMMDICSVNEGQMPRLFESFEQIGTLRPELASRFGLGSVAVAAGAGDNAAAAIGTGTTGNSECNISLGTSGTVFICSDTFIMDGANALHSFAHADGAYHLMGCILSAAACGKWWVEDILGTADYAKEDRHLGALGENRLFFLPYLMGERSPHNDPHARGCFIGIDIETTRADIMQAVYEGVAFALRDSFEVAKAMGIEVTRTKICGGGAKSEIWRKIIANVLDVEVNALENEEGPALGGALLAAVAAGSIKDVEAGARRVVKIAHTEKPCTETVRKYNEKYQIFRSLYPALKQSFSQMK